MVGPLSKLCAASSLKQQSADRHVAPLGQSHYPDS
jgi:hypothetical protein